MPTVRCEACRDYVGVAETKSFILRFKGEGERYLESVDLDGREPWSGVRCVCLRCLGFMRTLSDSPVSSDLLRSELESYLTDLSGAADMLEEMSNRSPYASIRDIVSHLRKIIEGRSDEIVKTDPG